MTLDAATEGPEAEGPLYDDSNANGFTREPMDPLRYNCESADPDEAAGIILGMIPRGARVLDVGCGTGSITRLIRDQCGAEVVGVEPHPGRSAQARERGLDVRTGYLAPELVEGLGAFDAVVFADVLEHLADPLELLVTARAALNPGGAVIVSVPNVAHWTVRFDLLRGRFNYATIGIMDATHLRWFTEAGVRLMLDRAGFEVEEVRGSAGVWMSDYQWRRPWRWLSPERRARVVRRAAKRWPTLFGAQHVVRAVPARTG